jgi:3-deoxy-D-manno-octulosonic-acid transferase
MILGAYRVLTGLGAPVIRLLLDRRARHGKEDPARRGERYGEASVPRPPGPLVWIHAASNGEALSALPLVRRLAEQGIRSLVTTGTVTSARLMAARLPRGAIHQYVPLDRRAWVRRFVDHWRPDAALWIESEIWPNTLLELAARDIPAALVNARMSERSFRRWSRAPRTARRLLAPFRVILAQTGREAKRLAQLSGRDVANVGNLKYAADPLPADSIAFGNLQGLVGRRPVWAFVSTHPGEDELAAVVHERLRERLPDLLTIIVPRHPDRGAEIASLLQQRGLWAARRSEGKLPNRTFQAYVVDTVGEMGIVLRVAPVACIGGSFVPLGGHNPIEPAQLGCTIVYGPSMFNFAEIAQELEAAGAAVRLNGVDDLAETVAQLLLDPEARIHQAGAARLVAERNRTVIDRVFESLEPLLAEVRGKTRTA